MLTNPGSSCVGIYFQFYIYLDLAKRTGFTKFRHRKQVSYRSFAMSRSFYLVLFCLVIHNGNTDTPVSGKKGGNITLTCEFKNDKIFETELFSQSEDIDVCQEKNCSGRVFKQRDCDVVIKNLRFSDAGNYILRVYYSNDETNERHPKEWKYQLHIYDEISVKTGKPLKLHVLMSFADKVEKNSGEGWKEVWKRGHVVSSDRMNVRDGNLIIKAFTDNDVGSYRVLDSERKILITVTVTESDTGSAEKRDTDKDKTDDTKEHKKWILPVVVCSVISAVAVISVIIWRYRPIVYRQAPVKDNLKPPDVPLTILTGHDGTAQES